MATAKRAPKRLLKSSTKRPPKSAAKRPGKKLVSKPTVAAPVKQDGPRRLKLPTYKSLRLSKRIRHPVRLPSAWRLTKMTTRMLWRHKRLFIGITLIYAILNLVLVQGLSNTTNITSLKATLQDAFGAGSAFTASLTVFAVLISSSGSAASGTGGAYQLFLIILVSLAIIWALRELLAGGRIRVRDAYYRGMYPLVPFILVLVVIGVQLIPLVLGATVYNIVISNGIAVLAAEKVLWALLFGLLALLSVYMISSSVFALYIVTLPDMTPLKALRSARALVRFRRWTVLRKILIMPVILLVITAVIMLPIILVITPVAQWTFYLLTMFAVTVSHTYLYSLYRELLHEQN